MSFLTGFEHFARENEPLAAYTWLRLGGSAQYFAEPTTIEELTALVKRSREEDLPVRLLGKGSNLLVNDQGVPGVVIQVAAPVFGNIEVSGNTIRAGGGALLGHVISTAVREGLGGLEQLAGIPGTIGGALHGNAGGSGGDVGQWTSEATVMTRSGELLTRTRDEMRFAYRQSSLNELVIVDVTFTLEPEDPAPLTRRLQKVWIVQRAGQPTLDERAACMFKNTQGMTTADLIESAGLRGTRVGQAALSDRDSNFVIVSEDATVDDVMRLFDLVKSKVADFHEIELDLAIDVW